MMLPDIFGLVDSLSIARNEKIYKISGLNKATIILKSINDKGSPNTENSNKI